MRILAYIVAIFLMPSSAWAEVLTWDCEFTVRVDGEGTANEHMNLVFKIDTQSGKAFMEGNVGIVEVGLHIGDEAFSFTENVASGTIQTTTITRDGLGVHSRNTVIAGEFVAAQYFGNCSF